MSRLASTHRRCHRVSQPARQRRLRPRRSVPSISRRAGLSNEERAARPTTHLEVSARILVVLGLGTTLALGPAQHKTSRRRRPPHLDRAIAACPITSASSSAASHAGRSRLPPVLTRLRCSRWSIFFLRSACLRRDEISRSRPPEAWYLAVRWAGVSAASTDSPSAQGSGAPARRTTLQPEATGAERTLDEPLPTCPDSRALRERLVEAFLPAAAPFACLPALFLLAIEALREVHERV